MALAETARLLASIELQDKFSGTIKTIEGRLDAVGTKLDQVGTRARTGVDRAKTKFGELKASLRDSNTQIGLVGTVLAGIENFVPPDLRPFVRGLEDINNAAPRGIPGLIGTALSGLKTITAGAVTVVGNSVAGPGGLFPPAGAAGTAAGAAGTLGAGAIVGGVVIGAGAASLGLLALGKVVEATSTKAQLQASRDAFNTQQILKHTGMTLEQIRAKNTPPPVVNISIKNQVLGQSVTTTYSRYSTAVTGTGGQQI